MQRKSNQIQPAEMKTETPEYEAFCYCRNESMKKGATGEGAKLVKSCRKVKEANTIILKPIEGYRKGGK